MFKTALKARFFPRRGQYVAGLPGLSPLEETSVRITFNCR